MGSTISASLLAFSRELRTLERLLHEVARESAGDTCLPRALARNLARLAGRADEVALMALPCSGGEPDRLLGLTAQPQSSSNRN